MPSIHSTELLLILVVALLVIGPERLPAAIRTASLWLGRFRRSFYKVKAEIEREINADEVRRQLHNESVLADIREAKSDLRKTAGEARDSVNRIVNSKDFDPGASSATDEQLRNAAAEREAAVTGAGAGEEESGASEPDSGIARAAPRQDGSAAEASPASTASEEPAKVPGGPDPRGESATHAAPASVSGK